MNFKCTLLKLIFSLVISPIIVYGVLIFAGILGASYEISHGESFIIWLLMAILVSQCLTWKK